jgi:hypothetical protein
VRLHLPRLGATSAGSEGRWVRQGNQIIVGV